MKTETTGDRKTVRTMCPMNCHPTFCGMQVEVEDDRLVGITGDKENPDSRGFLCVRGKSAHQIIGNDQRILHPMRCRERGSGKWERITWDEALDQITAAIEAGERDQVMLWPGHGAVSNDFGVFAHAQLALRLANMAGFQWWDISMICWGLGALGIGLTGALEVNTKEDMGAHSDMVVLWGSNLVSQPHTARHVAEAKKRGAKIVAIDVRRSEACVMAHEAFIVKPGTDAALALAMMHVIVGEELHDSAFTSQHTLGFEKLREHLRQFTPEWAQEITGIEALRIAQLARDYAATPRAMICIGGSSMHKSGNGWQAGRAISCLPALTGKLGKPGSGLGPRHAGEPHGMGGNLIIDFAARPEGNYIPSQMASIGDAIENERIKTMLLFGTNFLSSFSETGRLANGLAKMNLVVCQDLFMNDTIRECADIVLPGTAWLEDVGCKMTATHLYLMDRALPPAGEARSMTSVVRSLAERLGLDGFYPWEGECGHIDAVLDHPVTGRATVEALRAEGGIRPLDTGPVAHPDLSFATPTGKIEYYSTVALEHGLPALPVYEDRDTGGFPLELRMGRTISHFHSFFDKGRALPALARIEQSPRLWISIEDARARDIAEGDQIRVHNGRGEANAIAAITDRVPAGTVWIHDGWPRFNSLSDGGKAIPDAATHIFPFSTGQAAFDTFVEVSLPEPTESSFLPA